MNGTVRHGRDHSISWHADTEVALGPVIFDANGIRIAVDAASPADVVDLAARDYSALRAAAALFTDPRVIMTIAEAADGTRTRDPGPMLGPDLTRVATVSCVDAIHLGDVDAGVLLVDQAMARMSSGDPGAGAYLGLAAAVPDRIADEIDAADYRGPLVERILDVVARAPRMLTESERTGILQALDRRADADDLQWQEFLTDVTTELGPALAVDLGSAGTASTYLADLRPLPPRLLRFAGPDEPEVTVQVLDETTVTVTAELRPDVDSDTDEVAGIFAVAADAARGDLLAFGPTTVTDGQLRATIRLPDLDPATARYAFIGSDIDIDAVRLDPLGLSLTRIDRYCAYAWSQHRLAGALRASVGASADEATIRRAQDAAETASERASDAIRTARGLTRSLVRRHRSSPRAAAVSEYVAAVGRLGDRLAEPPAIDGPTGPTIAELHAVALSRGSSL
ncbi:MAG: hypothetical protein QM662_12725 [Gordonia sp. (in: high G+C Gram-positive bacteria)]